MLIIALSSDDESKEVATYRAVSISVTNSTVEGVDLGIPVCREVTMRICKLLSQNVFISYD